MVIRSMSLVLFAAMLLFCLGCQPKIADLPAQTCVDGMQNQGEEGVDCGGPCMACPQTEPEPEPETVIEAAKFVIVETKDFTPDGHWLSTYGDFSSLEKLDEICESLVSVGSEAAGFECRMQHYSEDGQTCDPEQYNYRINGLWKEKYARHPTLRSCTPGSQGICEPRAYLRYVNCTG